MVYLVSLQYELKQEASSPVKALEEALARLADGEVQVEYVNVWPQKPENKEGE